MAIIVNGDGILTGVSSLATALTDLTSGRGTVTGVATVGTLQLGAGVSMGSPRSQNAAIFTNNSEFLTVDDAGRVGVGTVTPNSDAHPQNVGKINVGFITARSIAGDIDGNTLVVAGISTFVGALNAAAVSGTTGTFSGVIKIPDGSTSAPSIAASSDTNSGLYFAGADAVGLVAGGSRKLLANSSGITINNGDLSIDDKIIHSGDTNTAIRFPEADNISLETGGTERLRLNNQYLIKGHTSVYPIAGHYPSVQLTGTTFNDATLSLINNANDATGSYIYLSKQRSGSQGGATVVQDDDLVGQIGWTAGDGTDVTSRIAEIKGFVDATPGSNDTPGRLSFWTTPDGAQSSLERLRINREGQMSLGGSSANTFAGLQRFDIFNTSTADNYHGSLIRLITKNAAGNATASYDMVKYKEGTVSHNNNESSGAINFYAGGATRLQILSTGNINVNDGDVVLASGHGIDFSATAQAPSPSSEILDDYEEGTWTFAITPGGGSYQYNYGQTGYYSKIGNKVFINAWVHLVVSSAVSGGITISGLPFPCQNRSRNWIPVGGYGHGGPPIASSGLWLILTPNAATGSFTYNDDQFGATSNLTAGNLPNSAEMYINGCYITDS